MVPPKRLPASHRSDDKEWFAASGNRTRTIIVSRLHHKMHGVRELCWQRRADPRL